MKLPYVLDGKIYDENDRVVEKPSILIVDGKFIAYGSQGYLKFKSNIEGRKLLNGGKSLMLINLIPLHEYLDVQSCLSIIITCILEEGAFDGSAEKYDEFINDLVKRCDRKDFGYWLKYRFLNE